MEEKLPIRINIADRYYPLKIDRKDEERIRKAAKMISDKVLQYKQKYSDKDDQDFLAMTALQYVNKYLESEERVDDSAIIEEIRDLNNELSSYLEKE